MTLPQLRRSSMVSNSGTMLTSSSPLARPQQPDLLQQQRDFEHVGDDVALEMT